MTSGFGDLAPWGGVGKLSTVNLSGLFMFHGILRAFLTTLFVMISLCLWRTGYAYGDWAALALLPLAIVLVGKVLRRAASEAHADPARLRRAYDLAWNRGV